jgi:hypothetical protein
MAIVGGTRSQLSLA